MIARLIKRYRTAKDKRYRENDIAAFAEIGHAKLSGGSKIGKFAKLHGNVEIGFYSTIGYFSYLHASQGHIFIGNYCAIAPFVSIYAVNHAINHLTLFNGQSLLNGKLKKYKSIKKVHIGHDVWIGHGTTILGGVSIGNGVVIGAQSVVTKDIPDFHIAIGNPAQVIKKRFNDEIVELIQESQWWLYSTETLKIYEDLFSININMNPELAKKFLVDLISRKQSIADAEAVIKDCTAV